MTAYLLQHELFIQAQRWPERPLLREQDSVSTYADVAAGAKSIARTLATCGVGRGDRVLLCANNCRLWVEAYYGILSAAAVVVPVNAEISAAGLTSCLEDSGAQVIIASARSLRMLRMALPSINPQPVLLLDDCSDLKGLPAQPVYANADVDTPEAVPQQQIDSDLACVIYTSGSTGKPRGAALSHGNLLANQRSILSYLPILESDRALVVLPFSYIFGLSVLHTHVAAGACLVLENRFRYPQLVVDRMLSDACTSFSGVPSTYAILLARSTFASTAMPQLRYLAQAGGAMSPALIAQLLDVIDARVDFFVMYGATEAAGRLAYVPPQQLRAKIGSIGRAIPNVELLLVCSDGRLAKTDEEGEIVARGSCIMQGYLNDADESQKVVSTLGLHTGDLGYRDADGFIFVTGRQKDMIKAGAHRVSPKEIEEALLAHESVFEAAVIGVPDALLGEKIYAYVVAKGIPVPERELLRFTAQRLPSYKMPSLLEWVPELPKNQAGKVLKAQLKTAVLAKGATTEAKEG